MSNLIFTGKTGKLTTSLRQSLSSLKEEKKALQEKAKVIFLLDCSGSMDEWIKGERKIDALRKVMNDYGKCQKIVFSSSATISSHIPNPSCSTNMAAGFQLVGTLNPHRIICISDGLPNDEEEALKEAKKLNIPIDVIYIGLGNDAGEAFMKRLASECGGSEITINTTDTNINLQTQLSQSIAGLISYQER